jgi:hypothetical protein
MSRAPTVALFICEICDEVGSFNWLRVASTAPCQGISPRGDQRAQETFGSAVARMEKGLAMLVWTC